MPIKINEIGKDISFINSLVEIINNDTLTILPTRRAVREFTKSVKGTSTAPHILTQEAFFDSILDTGYLIPADNLIKHFFLRKAILKTQKSKDMLKKSFEDMKSITKLESFISILIKFYQEIFENRVSFDCLKKESLYTDFQNEVEILKEVYKNYEGMLRSSGLIDANSLKNSLSIKYNIKEKTINIALSGLLSRYEQDTLEELSKTHNINIFISNNTVLHKRTAEWLYEFGYNQTARISIPSAGIYRLESKTQAAAWILETIYKEHYENGTNLEDIAVVLPYEPLAGYLRLINREMFNFAAGFSLSENIYIRFLNLVLKTLSNKTQYGYLTKNVVSLANHPFISLKNMKNYILPIYDKSILNQKKPFECIKKIYEKDDISLRDASKILLLCFKNINYTSGHYDFITSAGILFDELERLSLLNQDIINVSDSGENILIFLSRILSGKKFPDAGIGKVSVTGVLESRLLEKPVLIMPSLNDGILPESVGKDLFLNSHIRSGCGLPTYKDRENLQRYYFNSIINNSKKVYLGYIDNDTENISKFLSDFIFDTNARVETAKSQIQYIFNEKIDVILKKQTDAVERNDYVDEEISRMSLSAHSLSDFKSCPFKFYLKYIKKIKEEMTFTDESVYESGNIIHSVMDKLYSGKKPINNRHILVEKFEHLFKEELKTSLYYAVNPKEQMEMEYMFYRIKNSDFFSREAQSQALKIDTEKKFEEKINGKTVKGRIDRINYYENGFEVIDYKSGNIYDIKNLIRPYNMQLPLYAYVLQKQEKIKCINMEYYSFKTLNEQRLDYMLEHMDRFENDLNETIDKIKTGQIFEKNKKKCRFCPYVRICRI